MFLLSLILSSILGFLPFHDTDQVVLESALKNESVLITLSMLALEKSRTTSVRSLAADILAHHSAIDRGLHDLYRRSGKEEPITGYRGNIRYLNRLAALPRHAFDTTVTRDLMECADERQRLFEEAARHPGKSALASLAADVLPTIARDARGAQAVRARFSVADARGG